MLKNHCLIASIAAFSIITMLGCNPKVEEGIPETRTGTAHGTILVKGQPVSGGELNLLSSETGVGASCLIEPNGSFDFQTDIPIGTYKVAANPYGEPGKEIGKEIPAVVAFPDYSSVSVTISEGENELTVELDP